MSYNTNDLIIRLKNGYLARRDNVIVRYSKLNEGVLAILKNSHFISDFKTEQSGAKKSIDVTLLYNNNSPAIHEARIISKSGRRMYGRAKDLKSAKRSLGISIVSTSQGVMSDKDAKIKKIGGEILFQVW